MGKYKQMSFRYNNDEIEMWLHLLGEQIAREGIPYITTPERARSEVIRRAIKLYAELEGLLDGDVE